MVRNFQIVMLLIGLGVLIYAVAMFFMPTAEKREEARHHMHERFNRVMHED
jgi:phage shock protein PspC (stress-responsive transcriptional regulator)